MAITRSRITGKLLLPSGEAAPGGVIALRLTIDAGSVEDSGTGTQRVGGVYKATIGSDGSVDFYLIPNDVITPSGSLYVADHTLSGGASFTERWNLTTGDKEIGDITRV